MGLARPLRAAGRALRLCETNAGSVALVRSARVSTLRWNHTSPVPCAEYPSEGQVAPRLLQLCDDGVGEPALPMLGRASVLSFWGFMQFHFNSQGGRLQSCLGMRADRRVVR